ncbi:MAG: SpaH/EbpB family LPXTG-anchored major pilin [Olsenella sp.]|jgi:fimbrial isopeptide formation D2 family protein/LPXTG-motif cell wall-anchored protein|nr:SpaH/EbpB family LPXTG-anchored major pilin [Olsenella sp.]MCI1667003.1 SpaH/EbpB family LPXTG-anchored major pilin [Olsenella sp.]MCI1793803.1 SpaH/EbpB family LPXTG-anchored major pilin [Olsenella sp.]MCI1811354.1 SpaH/EbpB family LPXTG-anchored major pilin [Olsenella sp.]MCI1880453.1 SpaH/EbpB family LPXTG-anchored major pilin [Olsenella sp.]
MKHLGKKLTSVIAAVLAVVMALALAPTAYAAGSGYKLTLTGTATGHTYEAYQIFTGDLSTKEDGTKVLSNVKWGEGVTYTGTESAADVAKALGDGTMTIAQLEEKLTLTTPAKTVASAKDSTVIDGLDAGYYLVKDKDGSQADKNDAYTKFIVQVVGDTEAKIKSDVPTVVKKVKDTNDSTGTTSDWQDSADADINDDVQYQITGTMPSNIADYTTYKYVFTDTMSKGLTYTAKNAKVTIGGKDVTSSFTETVTANADGTTTVTWACDNLKGIEGVTLDANTKVVVTYSAKLNENAVLGAAGNPNEVDLTYSNNPNKGGEGETGKTPKDKNIVFTYKTVVNKVDQDKKSLAGAAFKLEKKQSDGTYKTVKEFIAGEETSFEFKGLDDGDYKLTETTTPAGYNTISPIEFTISAEHDANSANPALTSLSGNVTTGEATFTVEKDAGSLTTDVVNKKGSTLPSTGGMGTTVLYVAGAAIVVAAGVGLAIRRNKRRDA